MDDAVYTQAEKLAAIELAVLLLTRTRKYSFVDGGPSGSEWAQGAAAREAATDLKRLYDAERAERQAA